MSLRICMDVTELPMSWRVRRFPWLPGNFSLFCNLGPQALPGQPRPRGGRAAAMAVFSSTYIDSLSVSVSVSALKYRRCK